MGNARFVIFSRNRAMQLQALLESLYSNIVESKINSVAVIYKADPHFISSYNKLKENFGSIEWIEETDFRAQTIDAIKTDSEFTSFLVDDVMVHSKIQEDFLSSPLHHHQRIKLKYFSHFWPHIETKKNKRTNERTKK